jgi:hypothetical protein
VCRRWRETFCLKTVLCCPLALAAQHLDNPLRELPLLSLALNSFLWYAAREILEGFRWSRSLYSTLTWRLHYLQVYDPMSLAVGWGGWQWSEFVPYYYSSNARTSFSRLSERAKRSCARCRDIMTSFRQRPSHSAISCAVQGAHLISPSHFVSATFRVYSLCCA